MENILNKYNRARSHKLLSISRVYYKVFGLKAYADITCIHYEDAFAYRCALQYSNEAIIIKKMDDKWIDMAQNKVTDLSSMLGNAIDAALIAVAA